MASDEATTLRCGVDCCQDDAVVTVQPPVEAVIGNTQFAGPAFGLCVDHWCAWENRVGQRTQRGRKADVVSCT